MESKIFLLIATICIFLAVISAGHFKDDRSSQENLPLEDSSSLKEAVHEGFATRKKRSTETTQTARQKQINGKLKKAEEEQQKKNLELALVTTKLAELEKQKEAEKIDATTAPNKLTKWQKNLLNEINKTKAKKEDLTLQSAVAKTSVEQLKQQLTTEGGSTTSSTTKSVSEQNQINGKIKKAEEKQTKVEMELALVTTKLEQLEKQKEAENIKTDSATNNLTKKQKTLLNDIEKTKEKKYGLTLQAALAKTLGEQLKQQLNANGSSS